MSHAEGAYGCRSRVPLPQAGQLACMKLAWRICQSKLIVLTNFPNHGAKRGDIVDLVD